MQKKTAPKHQDPESEEEEEEKNYDEEDEDLDENEGEEEYGDEEEENPDEMIGIEPNLAMLAWADLFKDEAKLAALSEQIWNEYNPEQKENLSQDQANLARIALNKEFFKYVKTGQPLVEEEDPDNFPITKTDSFTNQYDGNVEKIIFMRHAERLGDHVNLFETLGRKVMPAFYSVYEEGYKAKEKKPVTREVYLNFFSDVAEKMGLEGEEKEEMFDEVDEATESYEECEGGYIFDLRTCMLMLKDNFSRKSDYYLFKTKLFSKYSTLE